MKKERRITLYNKATRKRISSLELHHTADKVDIYAAVIECLSEYVAYCDIKSRSDVDRNIIIEES